MKAIKKSVEEQATWLVIFGAGPVTRALAPLMQSAGFRVSVVDDTEELLREEAFPGVEELVFDDMEGAAKYLDHGPDIYAVLLAKDSARDKAVLDQLLGRGYPYLGIIGTTEKIASMIEELHGEGKNDEVFSRLHVPIGLDIGAETPEEVAISIAAEIVAVKRGRMGVHKKKGYKKAPVNDATDGCS